MRFDVDSFVRNMRWYKRVLPFLLQHSLLRSLTECRPEAISTPNFGADWLEWSPVSLLGLLVKYGIVFPFVIAAYVWLCVTTSTKLVMWVALMPVFVCYFILVDTRVDDGEDATELT